MNKKIKLLTLALSAIAFSLLSGCAAGSATAGYALRARCANSLSSSAEQRIVNRIERELLIPFEAPKESAEECLSESNSSESVKGLQLSNENSSEEKAPEGIAGEELAVSK